MRSVDHVEQLDRPGTSLIFPNILIERGTEQPDSPYLCEVSGPDYTYGEVLDRGLRLAHAMKKNGVRPGDRVSSMIPTSADSVIIMAAAAFLGAIHVPINTAYVGYMFEHALQLTTPRLLIVESEFANRLEEVAIPADTRLFLRDSAEHDGAIGTGGDLARDADGTYESMLAHQPLELRDVQVVEWDETGTLLFTSGTTGSSKAVIIPWYHLYLSSKRMWQSESLDESIRFYCPWPINHVTGAGAAYLVALLGGVLVLRSRWSTSNFVADITEYRCTVTDLMAEMVGYFEKMSGLDQTELTHIFVAPVTRSVGPLLDGLGIKYCTNYNSTETNSPIGSVGYEPVPAGSCGRLRRGVQARLVDENGNDVVTSTAGELLLRADDAAAMNGGYWGMPEATAEAWSGGWFHTGDLLRIDEDGFFYVSGRLKDRIRVRGENVNPDEVEAVVRTRADVAQCAAVGRRLPDGGDEIWLYVVPAEGGFDEADARAFCELQLPKFMRPAQFTTVEELPMTPTGKVQRAALRKQLND